MLYIPFNHSSEISSISQQQRLSVDVSILLQLPHIQQFVFPIRVFNYSSLLSSEHISLMCRNKYYFCSK